MPSVKRFGGKASWDPRKIISVYAGGGKLAYLSQRDNSTNIFIKNLDGLGKQCNAPSDQVLLIFRCLLMKRKLFFQNEMGKSPDSSLQILRTATFVAK